MLNIYYMTVIIGGDPYVPDNTTITKSKVYMNITVVNSDSSGTLWFSSPINMT